MQVRDLTQWQRQHLDEMTRDIMIMGVMWGINAENRNKIVQLGLAPGNGMLTAADLITEAMGDFPASTPEIRPSVFDNFLNTLAGITAEEQPAGTDKS